MTAGTNGSVPQLQNEIKIHKSMSHRHIVNFEHYFEDKDNVYLVLELCHNKVRFGAEVLLGVVRPRS